MKLRSMTGFGNARIKVGKIGIIECVISSFNRRQLDVRVVLPDSLYMYEAEIIRLIKEEITRGAINCNLRFLRFASNTTLQLNPTIARKYLELSERLATELKIENDVSMSVLLRLPGVINDRENALSVEVMGKIKEVTRKAIDKLIKMKRKEGVFIGRDINAKVRTLKTILSGIKKNAPLIKEKYKKSLKQRLMSADVQFKDNDERLMKEIVMFAEKCDISEEITRIDSHLFQLETVMQTSEEAGRYMDFLCQEIIREINTIGAKANDLEIAKKVINFKSTLEKIREQVQNVE